MGPGWRAVQVVRVVAMVVAAVAGIGLLMTASLAWSQVGQLRAQVGQLQEERDKQARYLKEIEIDARSVRSEMEDLKGSIADFSDGFSNPRDVMDEVERKAAKLEEAISDLENGLTTGTREAGE